MVQKTLTELTSDVVRRLAQVPGVAVQTYAEPTIQQAIKSHFALVAEKEWWDHLMYWQAVATDATTGVPTTDLSLLTAPITDQRHIEGIYVSDARKQLPRLSGRLNPYVLSGDKAKYIEYTPNQTTFFRIWPLTSTDSLYVHYRHVPTAPTTYPFDAEYLTLAAVYDYLEDDGTNTGQIEKFKNLTDMRFGQLQEQQQQTDIPLRTDGRDGGDYPTDWEWV